MNLKTLKAESHNLEPLVRIGKNGVTDNVIAEINKHLRLKKMIKIKILKSCKENFESKDIINKVLEKTQTILVSSIGNTFTIFKGSSQKIGQNQG